ncbi:phthiocerol/phthiodiolone dimycocerosyl transferase family protein [Nocardia gamkensis]|uniref:Phthiocerol/phthiodiolone dimycocerosyl transferase n=1 Tax=Nocardia gamkensis TaxID=352869 RepID=A0A7X6KZC1_9NOCA|nr:hypothetical protein [Nocardia gamkensis]NKY24966.1 hypothetical protein [Nocardia gamkensis]NQE66748.1 Phthiocerol/phthiodiolone dimycocerosyl transferase [Nocardia gamkensis]
MSARNSIRRLAPSEALFFDLGVFVGYSVRVRGVLDIPALSAAFEALRRSYPVLAAHVEIVDGHHLLVESPGPLPGVSVYAGDPGQPLSGANLDWGRALSGLHVVYDGDCASVTLVTHHCIADGHHSVAMLIDLWSLFTDTVGGRTPDTVLHDYPESMEKLFADRGISPPDIGSAEPARSAGIQLPAPGCTEPDRTMTQLRCHLSARVTDELIAFGRRHGVTVNGLVSAAIVRTEADVRNLRLADITYSYLVDLRTHVTPPVEFTAGTNVIGFAVYRAPAGSIELIDLARGINEQLRTDLADGRIQREALIAANNPAPPECGEVRCSNGGVVPPLRSPAGLEPVDCRPVPTGFPFPLYTIHRFSGRLSIELFVPAGESGDDIDAARRRIATLESHLRCLV